MGFMAGRPNLSPSDQATFDGMSEQAQARQVTRCNQVKNKGRASGLCLFRIAAAIRRRSLAGHALDARLRREHRHRGQLVGCGLLARPRGRSATGPGRRVGGATFAGLRHTRTTANCVPQLAFGTRIRSLNFQPAFSDGLALAASTKRARGWQFGLVRTTANLYGSAASPVNRPSMRAQASGNRAQRMRRADRLRLDRVAGDFGLGLGGQRRQGNGSQQEQMQGAWEWTPLDFMTWARRLPRVRPEPRPAFERSFTGCARLCHSRAVAGIGVRSASAARQIKTRSISNS